METFFRENRSEVTKTMVLDYTRTSKQGVATMNVAFEISSKEELNRVIDKLHNIESVLSIERTTG